MLSTMLDVWAQCFYIVYYNMEVLNNRQLLKSEKDRINETIKVNNIRIELLRNIFETSASYSTLRKLPKIREEARRKAIANFNKKYYPEEGKQKNV